MRFRYIEGKDCDSGSLLIFWRVGLFGGRAGSRSRRIRGWLQKYCCQGSDGTMMSLEVAEHSLGDSCGVCSVIALM